MLSNLFFAIQLKQIFPLTFQNFVNRTWMNCHQISWLLEDKNAYYYQLGEEKLSGMYDVLAFLHSCSKITTVLCDWMAFDKITGKLSTKKVLHIKAGRWCVPPDVFPFLSVGKIALQPWMVVFKLFSPETSQDLLRIIELSPITFNPAFVNLWSNSLKEDPDFAHIKGSCVIHIHAFWNATARVMEIVSFSNCVHFWGQIHEVSMFCIFNGILVAFEMASTKKIEKSSNFHYSCSNHNTNIFELCHSSLRTTH